MSSTIPKYACDIQLNPKHYKNMSIKNREDNYVKNEENCHVVHQ